MASHAAVLSISSDMSITAHQCGKVLDCLYGVFPFGGNVCHRSPRKEIRGLPEFRSFCPGLCKVVNYSREQSYLERLVWSGFQGKIVHPVPQLCGWHFAKLVNGFAQLQCKPVQE